MKKIILIIIALVVLIAAGYLLRDELPKSSQNKIEQIEDGVDEFKWKADAIDAIIREAPAAGADESHPPRTNISIRSVSITGLNKIQASVRAGLDYWHARDKDPCTEPRIYRLDRLTYRTSSGDTVRINGGLSQFGGCVIWLDGPTLKWMSDKEDCALIVHELGHTASLTFSPHPRGDPYHSLTGLMSYNGGGVMPKGCGLAF